MTDAPATNHASAAATPDWVLAPFEPGTGRAPSFVHIGGQRCGSSWMHRCLAEHPEVFTPEPKELHYFTRHHAMGDAWYRARFTPGPGHKAWGESTPMYISYEPAAAALHAINPACRLACCLRNPIDRAFSIFQLKRNTDMAGVTFEQVLDDNVDDVWDRGLYLKHIKRWIELFGADALLIQIYDDLVKDDARIVRELYAHIGVDAAYRPTWLGKTQNAVIMPGVQDKLKKSGMGWVIRKVRNSPVGPAIRRWNKSQKAQKAGSYQGMSTETKARLAEFYKEPNAELGAFLKRDLSHWTPAEFR